MRPVALVALLAACGDNGDPCGYVDPIESFKNIWSLQLAVDATHIYSSDYDVDGEGTALVIREPLAGGPIQALGVRPTNQTFGRGVALDNTYLFWSAINDEASSSFFASPIAGGMPLLLAPLPACAPSGVAIDARFAYAGTLGCNDLPSSVIAVESATGTRSVVWTSEPSQGDVRALATGGGALFIGISTALFALRDGTLETLAGSPTHHLEVHEDTLYYSTDEGGYLHRPRRRWRSRPALHVSERRDRDRVVRRRWKRSLLRRIAAHAVHAAHGRAAAHHRREPRRRHRADRRAGWLGVLERAVPAGDDQ